MQKRILVPNGSYTEIRLIEAYKKMGLYVITSGNAPELEGHKYADQYVCHDYSDLLWQKASSFRSDGFGLA